MVETQGTKKGNNSVAIIQYWISNVDNEMFSNQHCLGNLADSLTNTNPLKIFP